MSGQKMTLFSLDYCSNAGVLDQLTLANVHLMADQMVIKKGLTKFSVCRSS